MTSQKNEATRVETPFRVIVQRADPNFDKERLSEAEYEFTGRSGTRAFKANPATRGAYAPDAQES